VIGRPSAGVRVEVVRIEAETGAPPAAYRGFAFLPDADLPLALSIDPVTGAVNARIDAPTTMEPERVAELERMAAALVRSATKPAVAQNQPLPRKIVRWRP
jgi:hypothetical protein